MIGVEFFNYHEPALSRREIRHNLILAQLERMATDPGFEVNVWSLGGPGACAIMIPGKPIILGELLQEQCNQLVELTQAIDYSSVVGPDQSPLWFQQHATKLGIHFDKTVPQRIYGISTPPIYPNTPGAARIAGQDDLDLMTQWIAAFVQAATNDVVPKREKVAEIIDAGQHMLWEVDGTPVSMAAINRRTRHVAAIGAVYTPPEHRQKGYAGSVTAAVVERVYGEGKTFACLYTDLRNPHSNRCYMKIGFNAECDSMQIVRRRY